MITGKPPLDEIEIEGNIQESIESLDYWIGIDECNCNAQYPTGGCQYCDLIKIRNLLIEMK